MVNGDINEKILSLKNIVKKIDKESGSYFSSIINNENMECEIIKIKPSEKDTQTPHSSNEIYYIINGSGCIEINEKIYEIKKDDIIFIPKDFSHRFHSNKAQMTILYVIA